MIVGHVGGGSVGPDVGDIGRSLRLRSSASAYLSRTPGSSGNLAKWTWSGWTKIGNLATDNYLFAAAVDANNRTLLAWNAGNLIFVSIQGGVVRFNKISTAAFRDFGSFYHVVCAFDTTNATTEDRVKLYINGVRITAFSTNTFVDQTNHTVNLSGALHTHFRRPESAANYNDGYLARVCFVDGQALTPSSFGYFNTEINEWVSRSQSQVKAVVDAGGANSFMLDFDNGASLTTLGYDKSSKGNNWTLNNVSLTAGTTYDHMLDVPGNSFATFNPLVNATSATLSEANIAATSAVSAQQYAYVTQRVRSKVYCEFGYNNILNDTSNWFGVQFSNGAVRYYASNGQVFNGSTWAAYGSSYNSTNIVALAVDPLNGEVTFYRDGVSQGAITGLGASASAAIVSAVYVSGGNAVVRLMSGQAPLHASATYRSASGGYFRYAPPTDYKALCQRNMPDGESITTSGSFTGTLNADGPYIDIGGVPTAMTINGNAVTFGTHADKTSSGFKLRTSSSSYNNTGSNTFSVTSTGPKRKYSLAQGNP